ncbi:N-acetylmuramoyl-L-alanine amidase [Nocardia pseudobrasiliensis]|uniref:N-acetylmuramoyl-L-alanine amidase n=1 Tax=Nocardia pseudobrasiliensis TaxID=45979 RepID=A0A370IEM0_9NOCA|nr:N-acetylmuramoyl-L-alanine amidase [Nocardia pseudobrasiliensis]
MKHPSIIRSCLCLTVAATATAAIPAAALADSPVGAPPSAVMSTRLAGKTVFLDPGHQGVNHTQQLDRPVNDGRGGTKACQTTGMTTMHGVAEHSINWNVAQMVKQSLEALGARVLLSRQDDTGWGGCVDERAAAANASGADVAMSIHADGAPANARGFHLIVPQLPVPDAKAAQVQSTTGLAATKAMRAAYLRAGFPAANYGGAVDALMTRDDIAGPALTEVPEVFLEMGNGQNPDDAQSLETPEGRLKHAVAITTGLVGYLLNISVDGMTATQGSQLPAGDAGSQPQGAPAGPNGSPRPIGAVGQADSQPSAAVQDNSQPSAGQNHPRIPAATGQAGTQPQSVPAGQNGSLPPIGAAGQGGSQPQSVPAGQNGSLPPIGVAGQGGSPLPGGATGQGGSQVPAAAGPGGTQAVPNMQGMVPGAQPPAGQGNSLSAAGSPEVGQSAAIDPGAQIPAASTPSGSGQNIPLPPSGSQGGGQVPLVDPRQPARTGPGSTPGIAPGGQDGYAQTPPNAVSPGMYSSPPPGYQAMPGTQPMPGTQSSPTLPGTQGAPGTGTLPGTGGTGQSSDTAAAVGTLVTTAMHLLLPLAKTLGLGDATVNSELINLAYNLVATLITPWTK